MTYATGLFIPSTLLDNVWLIQHILHAHMILLKVQMPKGIDIATNDLFETKSDQQMTDIILKVTQRSTDAQ